MNVRYFALIFGIVFLLVGLAGFVPGLVTPMASHDHLTVSAGAGLLFNLFPVNVLHNIVHLAFGVWGVLAYRTFANAKLYARAVAVIYGVLTILGLLPFTNTTFGLVPIYGNDIWLHALLAAVAAYFGFVAREEPALAVDKRASYRS
jgi:hypothetical protein